ncbi:MAG: MFS transporter [Chloroflexi bacterium]|nr:MFS transporter [Chloroflexota bacterium]
MSNLTPTPLAIRWLSLAHFANDFFSGSLGVLLASQAEKLDLSNGQIGLASTAYLALSFGQPLLGWLADRTGQAFLMVTGAFLTGIGLLLCGFAPTYAWLIFAALFAGLGSAMFHPVGLATARHLGQESTKGKTVALFMLGGNSGYSVAPFLIGFILEANGPHGMLFPFLVSLVFVPYILVRLRPAMLGQLTAAEKTNPPPQNTQTNRINRWQKTGFWMLVAYLAIVFVRGTVDQVLGTYLPTYYEQSGRSLSFAGVATGAVLFFSAIGSYMGARLSDHISRLLIMGVSMAIMPPMLLLLLESDGIGIFIFGAVLGVMLKASLPLLLMMGQEVFPGGASGASGLAFGWMFASNTIGTIIASLLSDAIGLKETLQAMALLPIIGLFMVILMRSQTKSTPRPQMAEIQAIPTVGD